MIERLNTEEVIAKNEDRFRDTARSVAEQFNQAWTEEKYKQIITDHALEIIDSANDAKQRYYEASNYLATLHGVGIDSGELRAVESPVIHLAKLLAGQELTLSGRENPTAEGVLPLRARLFATVPVPPYEELAFRRIKVELIDPNTGEVIGVESSLDHTAVDPDDFDHYYENAIKNHAISLLSPAFVNDCAYYDRSDGSKSFSAESNIRNATTYHYDEAIASHSSALQHATNDYVSFLDNETNAIIGDIGLLEWLVASAKDGNLNPSLVERMNGGPSPIISTTPDEYMVIFSDGQPSVDTTKPIKPWEQQSETKITGVPLFQ